MHTDSVVYDGQPGQPSLVHTDSVVYDGQPGQPSLVHTNSVVYDGQPGQLSEGKLVIEGYLLTIATILFLPASLVLFSATSTAINLKDTV